MNSNNDNGSGAPTTALIERPPVQQVPTPRREIRVVEDDTALGYLLDTARYEHTQRIATGMARASLIPSHLRGGSFEETIANCFLVVNQSLRWGFDPFAVAPETYSIGGKLAYQGKLIAAVVNARASLDGRLHYSFEGKGDDLAVTVAGRFRGESEDRTVTLSVQQAKTQNQMWTKDPEQKLIYSGVIRWARRYCPEIVLGVVTEDDAERMAETMARQPRRAAKTLAERMAPALPDTQLSDAEANHVIEQRTAASAAPGDTPPASSSAPPSPAAARADASEPDVPEAEQDTAPPEMVNVNGIDWPLVLPHPAGDAKSWIDDAVLALYPREKFSSGVAAKKAFHALHVNSWEKMTPEGRQAKYETLLNGTVWT